MRPIACALALLAAACTGSSADSTTLPAPATTDRAVTTTTLPSQTTTPVDPCPAGTRGPTGGFTASGPVASLGSAAGDAAAVAEIRLATDRPGPDREPDPAACERIVIDLATERGAPATAVGTTVVELLADVGVLRIMLPPAVAATAVADLELAGTFAHRAFVVAADGALFVDVHLSRPAVARAASTRSPASIVIDLIGGGTAPEARPAAGNSVVVLAPLGPMATYPIAVSGYARSDRGTVDVVVTGNGNASETVPIAVNPYPWQPYSAAVPSGPSGSVRLTAGDAVVLLSVP